MVARSIALAMHLFTPEDTNTLSALELQWDAPSSCPTTEAQRLRIASYLDPDAPVRQLRAEARIREQAMWTLTLTFEGKTRRLHASSCEELSEAAAVILSLALTPAGSEEPPAPSSLPSEPPPSATSGGSQVESPLVPRPVPPPPRTTQVVPPRPSDTRRVRGLLRADAGIGLGLTPTLTTVALTTGVVGLRMRAELTGTFWLPADATNLRGGSARTLVTLGSIQGRGCAVLRRRRVDFPVCGGVALGALRVDDIVESRVVTHRFWAGLTAGAAVAWRFRPYAALWAGPEITVALRRPEVPLVGTTLGYRSDPVAVRGAVGVEFYFSSRKRADAGKRSR